MESDLIHDRGRGPEIVGTRITVYNLLPHFLDATATEDDLCRLYELTPEQVAAARAYVLNNPETVLAEHLRIEARMSGGNPPDVIEKAKETHAVFMSFKEWLRNRDEAEAQEHMSGVTSKRDSTDTGHFPTFQEWLREQKSRTAAP